MIRSLSAGPKAKMFPPGLEPGTFRVLGERDNHYTTETSLYSSESLLLSRRECIRYSVYFDFILIKNCFNAG